MSHRIKMGWSLWLFFLPPTFFTYLLGAADQQIVTIQTPGRIIYIIR